MKETKVSKFEEAIFEAITKKLTPEQKELFVNAIKNENGEYEDLHQIVIASGGLGCLLVTKNVIKYAAIGSGLWIAVKLLKRR